MMGNHATSLVHDQLRVHGLEALRVIDASISARQRALKAIIPIDISFVSSAGMGTPDYSGPE
jgi:hypothetical protein